MSCLIAMYHLSFIDMNTYDHLVYNIRPKMNW